MKDFYDNEVEADTPTTRLLAKRNAKQESDGLFKLATKITDPMRASVVADYLRSAAKSIEASHVEKVTFEFTCAEVRE